LQLGQLEIVLEIDLDQEMLVQVVQDLQEVLLERLEWDLEVLERFEANLA